MPDSVVSCVKAIAAFKQQTSNDILTAAMRHTSEVRSESIFGTKNEQYCESSKQFLSNFLEYRKVSAKLLLFVAEKCRAWCSVMQFLAGKTFHVMNGKGYVRSENIRCKAQFWRKNAKAEKVKERERGVFSLV